MSRVRVHNLSVSLDGFAVGAGQSLQSPFGHAEDRLTRWLFGTRTFHAMRGEPGGSHGVDEAFASDWGQASARKSWAATSSGPSAVRGPTRSTHHPRPAIEMEGGTTFHFINAGPAEALDTAREAAGGLDVRIGGGPSTVRQFLAADLIDHLHVVLVPIVLGRGERL